MKDLHTYWQSSPAKQQFVRNAHTAKTEDEFFGELTERVRDEHPDLGEDDIHDIVNEVAEFSNERGHTGLLRLDAPKKCSIGKYPDEIQCENMAQWSFNGYPLCQDHLRGMAEMNGDNYEAVKIALNNPLRVVVITDEQKGIYCAECEKKPATVWVVTLEDGKECAKPRCDECKHW